MAVKSSKLAKPAFPLVASFQKKHKGGGGDYDIVLVTDGGNDSVQTTKSDLITFVNLVPNEGNILLLQSDDDVQLVDPADTSTQLGRDLGGGVRLLTIAAFDEVNKTPSVLVAQVVSGGTPTSLHRFRRKFKVTFIGEPKLIGTSGPLVIHAGDPNIIINP